MTHRGREVEVLAVATGGLARGGNLLQLGKPADLVWPGGDRGGGLASNHLEYIELSERDAAAIEIGDNTRTRRTPGRPRLCKGCSMKSTAYGRNCSTITTDAPGDHASFASTRSWVHRQPIESVAIGRMLRRYRSNWAMATAQLT